MSISTISQGISRGDISTYLAANDNALGAMFGTRIASPGSPLTIALVTDALRWGSNGGAQTDKSLRETTNFLIWLCGIYGQQAQVISESAGGGTVIPGGNITNLPNPYDWAIDVATSATEPMKAGDTSVTLDTFIGYNIEFTRGGITQNTTNLGDGSSYYSFNRNTGLFTIYQAAALGELFRILPTR
ncbi:MAG TPA: hypothetical protein VIL78_18730 [Hanamia sp.]